VLSGVFSDKEWNPMSKFNKVTARVVPHLKAPIQTSPQPTALTYNGAAGYEYDTLSQLFLLACSNMVGEDTFYESAEKRDSRFVQLIHKAVAEGHAEWLARFLPWLRNSANMRSASMIGGIEAACAMVGHKIPGGRQIVNSVLVRADEPGEALAYWTSTYSRAIPKPIKRGIADACARLYTQRNTIKYDTASKGFRFGQVLELVHAKPSSGVFVNEGRSLFTHLVDRAHGRGEIVSGLLTMLLAHKQLTAKAQKDPLVLLNTARLRQAGMTWEQAKSLTKGKVSDLDFWTAMIPEMGYMALLRNLRNFDQAGVKGDLARLVIERLRNPDEVAKSRQLPMRFLSAYRNVASNMWSQALEEALEHSLKSVPEFKGSTLILIDTSSSMNDKMSGRSELKCWDAASVFGLALARRCENVDVVSYSTTFHPFPAVKGESLLRSIARFEKGYFIGGGTATAEAVRRFYVRQDRLIILTDEQANPNSGVFTSVPQDKLAVTFNLAGYKVAHAASGPNRISAGGLSDAAFTMLGSLDSRREQRWPF
jgi:hypothetical protein